MAVDGWAVTFSTARRGLGGAPRCTKCNSPPINGFNVAIKGLKFKLKIERRQHNERQ